MSRSRDKRDEHAKDGWIKGKWVEEKGRKRRGGDKGKGVGRGRKKNDAKYKRFLLRFFEPHVFYAEQA